MSICMEQQTREAVKKKKGSVEGKWNDFLSLHSTRGLNSSIVPYGSFQNADVVAVR